ncbi:MAG: hypothetical protein DDT34_02220 [Firmicutes bacterium]|nr:hypothetical protein [Bacillota bacterium]
MKLSSNRATHDATMMAFLASAGAGKKNIVQVAIAYFGNGLKPAKDRLL